MCYASEYIQNNFSELGGALGLPPARPQVPRAASCHRSQSSLSRALCLKLGARHEGNTTPVLNGLIVWWVGKAQGQVFPIVWSVVYSRKVRDQLTQVSCQKHHLSSQLHSSCSPNSVADAVH